MEPIGSLDSVQHPLLYVCPGLRRFDVETVFLYPWAVAFTADCWHLLKPCFYCNFVIALVYAWRKGALECLTSNTELQKDESLTQLSDLNSRAFWKTSSLPLRLMTLQLVTAFQPLAVAVGTFAASLSLRPDWPRFDFHRFGLIPSPRQADLIITAGTITHVRLVRLYEQMPDPKYVIAMGACTITGGTASIRRLRFEVWTS